MLVGAFARNPGLAEGAGRVSQRMLATPSHSSQETRVYSVEDDEAGIICQARHGTPCHTIQLKDCGSTM